jgi:uncharacterized protein
MTADDPIEDLVLPPRGFLRAREIAAGERVRLADVAGRQVADLVLLRAGGDRDWMSCLYTKMLNGTERIGAGHVLYSKQALPLATVVRDTVGTHWFGGGFCSEETNRLRYGVEGTVNCRTNLAASLAGRIDGPNALELDSCASIFMDIRASAAGFTIGECPSGPGDLFEIRAECDLVLALSNCPEEHNPCNGFEPTEMRVTRYSA